MQDGHHTSINSSSLTADEVARRSFPTVRKGFDPTDVRMFLDSVAEQLHILHEREDDLRSRLARAEQQAAHPEIDEAMLTAALGQETTRVLRSAHDAAGDMKARAEEAASQVIHQAHEEAARIRAEGERAAAERASEAEVAAARIRSGAAAEADSVVEAARHEAQAMVGGVQEDCRAMVREAQEVRARVLADLVRRRRALYGQVEQLRGGRQNLVEALRDARRSFDHILEALQRDFDPGGAAHVAREAAADEAAALEVDPDKALATESGSTSGPGGISGARPGPAGATRTGSAPAATGAPASSSDRQGVEVGKLVPTAAVHEPATGAARDQPSAPEEPEAPDRLRSALRIIRRSRPEEEVAQHGDTDEASAAVTAEPQREEDVRLISSPSGTSTTPAAESEEVTPPSPPTPPRTAARRRGGGRHRAPGSSAVDELFAKIKTGRSESGGRGRHRRAGADAGEAAAGAPERGEETAPAVGPRSDETGANGDGAPPAPQAEPDGDTAPPAADAEPQPAPPADVGAQPAPPAAAEPEVSEEEKTEEETSEEKIVGPDDSYLRRRDDAVGPITVALSRKLKRALQDDHNDLLDRLRSRGKLRLSEILPPVADHQERYRQAGIEFLERAEQAGTSFLRAWKGSDGGTAGNGRDAGAGSSGLAGDLATAIVDPLRRRLERSFDDSEEVDEPSLVENVGSAYREWKGRRIERVAGDHVVAAFSRGELGAAKKGASLRWIVDDGDERCPDCDDNALAGPLPSGERYPTGQTHPPAHSGCRCLLAPPPA